MKPITSVLVKQKENEGEALPLPLSLLSDVWPCVPLGRKRRRHRCQDVAHGDGAAHAVLGAPNLPGLSLGSQSSALGLTEGHQGRLGGMAARGDLEGSCICLTWALSRALSGAEYGLKLGSQLFIKHIVENGLAAKGSSLQEGDLILKVREPQGRTAPSGDLTSPCSGGLSLAGVTAGDKGWQLGWRQLCLAPAPCSGSPAIARDPVWDLGDQIPVMPRLVG